MAISNDLIHAESPPPNSNRISLSHISRHSPQIIAAPESPTTSIHPPFVVLQEQEDYAHRTIDLFDRPTPVQTPLHTPSPTHVPASPHVSSMSDDLNGSTVEFKSPRQFISNDAASTIGFMSPHHSTFSEEKEVIAAIDDEESPRTVSPPLVTTVPPPLPTPADELAAARRASIIRAEGLGVHIEKGDLNEPSEAANVDMRALEEGEFGEHRQYEGVVMAAAQQAQLKRPRIINHSPSNASRRSFKPSRILGEGVEMQELEQSRIEQGGIVLPQSWVDRFGTGMSGLQRIGSQNSGLATAIKQRSNQTHLRNQNSKDRALDSTNAAESTSLTEAPVPSLSRNLSVLDALHSHPVDSSNTPKRAATLPTRKRRKTTFSTPPNLDTRAAAKFERGSLNTPYPGKTPDFPESDRGLSRSDVVYDIDLDEASSNGAVSSTRKVGPIHITVVLSGRASSAPKTSRITIPAPPPRFHGPTGRIKPPVAIRAFSLHPTVPAPETPKPAPTPLFDDFALARLLRAEYSSMRGWARARLSLRSLQRVRIVSGQNSSDMASTDAGNDASIDASALLVSSFDWMGEGVECGEPVPLVQKLGDLVMDPHSGKGKEELVSYFRTLSRTKEHIGVQLEEGWNVRRLGSVFIGVIVASLLAMLLWIFLGAGGGEIYRQGGSSGGMPIGEGTLQGSWRGEGPRERAEGGLVLGVLVLLVGWTGMAGWAVVSWLVV